MVVVREYIKKSTGLQDLHFRAHFSQSEQDSYGPEVDSNFTLGPVGAACGQLLVDWKDCLFYLY